MNLTNDHFQHPTSIPLSHPNQTLPRSHHSKNQWSPYEINGGNVVAYAKGDLLVLAGDTRISRGFSVLKRDATKIHRLTENTYILSGGMYADYTNLWKIMDERIKLYQLNIEKTPTTKAIAAMLSKILYDKRFFPFYAFNIVAGLEENGEYALYSYDAVGSYGLDEIRAIGNAHDLIQPLLDNQFTAYNSIQKPGKKLGEEIVEIIVDAFQSAAERDITCKDGVEVIAFKSGKMVMDKLFPLRKDWLRLIWLIVGDLEENG